MDKPTRSFVRDILVLAAIIVLFAEALAMTLNLRRGPSGVGAGSNLAIVAILYGLGGGLLFLLWRSQERPTRT